MAEFKSFIRSRKGLTFLALLLTLGLGITIGTIVSDGVFSAQERPAVSTLNVQGEGDPLVVDQQAALHEGFSHVVEAIGPAVVNISTQSVVERSMSRGGEVPGPFKEFFGDDFWDRFFGPDAPQRQKRASLGSGVIVDSTGYVLTNHHVVAPIEGTAGRREADKIEVQLSTGEKFVAEVIGVDPESDLAVLKINSAKKLPFAKVGDSTKLRVGDWVLAVGSPFGLEKTVTVGIVSATERVVPTGIFGNYIQTDAAINPGNSGGPLVNMRGEVVGVNSFITTNTGSFAGVGFAVPSSVFINSYNQLVTTGMIERGWLGVSMNLYPMTPEMAEFFGVAGDDPNGIKDSDGVIVTQIIDESGSPGAGGPADAAGIKPGDVIVKFGDREIEGLYDLRSAVANTPPGESVPVVVVRKAQVLNLNVKLAERTIERLERESSRGLSLDRREEAVPPKEIGLEFRTLTAEDRQQAGITDTTLRGVLILSVAPASLADEAGLEPRQIITQVNAAPIESAQQLKDQITSLPSGSGVVLRIVSIDAQRRQNIGYTSFTKP